MLLTPVKHRLERLRLFRRILQTSNDARFSDSADAKPFRLRRKSGAVSCGMSDDDVKLHQFKRLFDRQSVGIHSVITRTPY